MAQPASHSTAPYFLVWLALRLKGLGEVDGIAEVHGLGHNQTEDLLAQLADDGLCVHRLVDGVEKYILTPVGRDQGEAMLATELDNTGARPQVEDAYRRFRQLNPAMLKLCTDWQIIPAASATANVSAGSAQSLARRLNDHGDPCYDSMVIDRLRALDARLNLVLNQLGAVLNRYGHYRCRFTTALDRLVDGDLDYFTKPVIASYHTIWFELHEDLLATLNLNRSDERD